MLGLHIPHYRALGAPLQPGSVFPANERNHFTHLSVGDRITIAYRPKHPKLSAVQGLGDQPVVAELGFWAGRLCLGVALMALVMFPWPIVG